MLKGNISRQNKFVLYESEKSNNNSYCLTDKVIYNNINGDEVLFIGDTLHDLEVSNAMGAKCVLVSCGHQSIDVLSKGNVPILNNVNGLVDIL